MGCPKSVRERYKRDADWATYTTGFLRYLDSQSKAVKELADAAAKSRSCLVCFEADFNRCHRIYVARAAANINGMEISHLIGQKEISDGLVLSAA
jgi:uncharacterized protein YeaO (DUF488 family)